jgi:hypothetical protein
MRILSLLSAIVVLTACGSSAAPKKKASSPVDSDDLQYEAKAASHAPSMLPEACAEGEECMPPSKWVTKLCNGVHPEVALHMFRGGSPWKRVYSRKRAPAYNGAGGPSLLEERVEKGEELIALRRNTNGRDSTAGELSVGETAGYDLLRWNGSCVTLHDGEYSDKPPRRQAHARVEWRWLGDGVRTALQSDELVRAAYAERRKECKGATIGRVTKRCVECDASLVTAIVDYVRGGGTLPEPSERL